MDEGAEAAVKMDDSAEEAAPPKAEGPGDNDSGEVIGSAAIRPVFLGNLNPGYSPEAVTDIFEKPLQPDRSDVPYDPIPVDRIDQKRGYCFVFLKDAVTQADKERAERFVADINGMEVPGASKSVKAEFARGDGRIKRKEDERRRNIAPSETLFVVNFHEETTRKEDLEMLFSPYGKLVRIDMKRNYAFVQFDTVEAATKAKETTNGGKLDQSVLTVEFVARQRQDGGRGGDRRRRSRDRDDRRGGRDRGRDDYRGGGRRDNYGGHYGDRYDDRRGGGGGGRYDDRRYDDGRAYRGGGGRDSPPPYRGRRSHSRSRSPPSRYAHRSRSPPRGGRYDDRYDDFRRGPSPPRDNRGRSPDRGSDRDRGDREFYRGDRDRDRGYRG